MAQSSRRATSPSPDAFLRAARHPAYRAAMQAAQRKRFRDALKAFEHLAAAPPNADVGALARYQIGYCYLALNRKQHARTAFERFVQLHPNTPLTAPAQEKIRQLSQPPNHPTTQLPNHPTRADCGPAALLAICQYLGVKTTKEELARLAGTDATGTTMAGLAKAAKAKGLRVEGLWVDEVALQRTPLPALAWVNGNHWVAVVEVNRSYVTLFDPASAPRPSEPRRSRSGQTSTIPFEDFQRHWDGYLLRVWKPSG